MKRCKLNNKRKGSSSSSSSSESDSKRATHDRSLISISRLQSSWRASFRFRITRRYVRRFTEKVNSEYVQSISFEELVPLLRDDHVIAAGKACLQRIHFLSTFRHGSPAGVVAPESVNVRVFLAAYMISFRSTRVFETMGVLEQALFDAAAALIVSFERICSSVLAVDKGGFQNVPKTESEQFPTLLFDFMGRFKAWKIPDEAKLTSRIKHALIALFQARDQLPPDEPADGRLMVEFNTQIDRLKAKLAQIAGQAELTEFMMTVRLAHLPGGGLGGNNSGYVPLPGPMTNEALAHELLYDPAFELDESNGENSMSRRIRITFHRAFWDSLVDDLMLPMPCYARILRVLAEIRDGISNLAGPQEAPTIAEMIDVDFMRQQSGAGAFGWGSCTRLVEAVVGVVRRIQAPSRSADTACKWDTVQLSMFDAETRDQQSRAFCGALEFLLDRVSALRIDAANTRLRLIAPVIKDHGVEYERGKFQDKLAAGTLTLERTSEWIHRFVDPHLEKLSTGSTPAVTMAVHFDAILSLSTSDTVSLECVPETLLFDVHRLVDFRSRFRGIVDAASLIITVTNAVKPGAISDAVVELFLSDDAQPSAALVFDLAKQMSTAPLPDGLEQALVNAVKPDDAVRKLVVSRVMKLLRSIMEAGGGDVAPSNFIACAQHLLPRIEALGRKIYALANINRIVHTPTYNRIIEEAVAEYRTRGVLAA